MSTGVSDDARGGVRYTRKFADGILRIYVGAYQSQPVWVTEGLSIQKNQSTVWRIDVIDSASQGAFTLDVVTVRVLDAPGGTELLSYVSGTDAECVVSSSTPHVVLSIPAADSDALDFVVAQFEIVNTTGSVDTILAQGNCYLRP